MNRIIFLQTKLPDGFIELQDLSNRWKRYGKLVRGQGQSDGIRLFVLRKLSSKQFFELISDNTKFFPGFSPNSSVLLKIGILLKEIKLSQERITLVCSDSGISLLVALWLKSLKPFRTAIQIQFHGDIYNFHKNTGLGDLARVCFSRLGIFFADSIRVVSEFQKQEIVKISKNAAKKFVLAPVPIDWRKIPTEKVDSKIDIAFIGRLHPERGIEELLEVLNLVKEIQPTTKILIAGDGPCLDFAKIAMFRWIQNSTCFLPGFLNPTQIKNVYATSRILISTAPREGYGLTIREAALSGMQVVARDSDGVKEAFVSYPHSIHIYSEVHNAVQLLLEQMQLNSGIDTSQYYKSQELKDEESLNRLTRSWLSL